MKEIPRTQDPEDGSGPRCELVNGDFKCHRKKGHSTNTRTIHKYEDEEGEKVEEIVYINHRVMAGGRFFTW